MVDKDIVKQLKGLKQIKPNQAWVSSVKNQIIGEQSNPSILDVFSGVFNHKRLAFAGFSLVLFLVSAFGLAQSAMPGDLLFPIKKMAERSQGALLSSANQSNFNLDIANNRLQELVTIARENRAGNMAPAIQEYKKSVNEVTKSLASNTGTFEEIAVRIKTLQETKVDLETLGVIMVDPSDQINDALASLVKNEIQDLEKVTLNDNQKDTLEEIKKMCGKGGYSGALEMLLMIKSGK